MLAWIACFAALGGFLFGYDLGLIGGALENIRIQFQISDGSDAFVKEVIVGAAKLGALGGTLLGGALMLYYGRRVAIAVDSAFFIVGPLIMAAAISSIPGIIMLVAGRFIVGIGIGISAVVVPAYLGEVAPAKYRGRVVAVYEVLLCAGMLAANLGDAAFQHLPGNWRWMVGMPALPALFLSFALCLLPESPRWLVIHGKLDEALAVIHRIYTSRHLPQGVQNSTAEVNEELMELWSAVEKDKAAAQERRRQRHAASEAKRTKLAPLDDTSQQAGVLRFKGGWHRLQELEEESGGGAGGAGAVADVLPSVEAKGEPGGDGRASAADPHPETEPVPAKAVAEGMGGGLKVQAATLREGGQATGGHGRQQVDEAQQQQHHQQQWLEQTKGGIGGDDSGADPAEAPAPTLVMGLDGVTATSGLLPASNAVQQLEWTRAHGQGGGGGSQAGPLHRHSAPALGEGGSGGGAAGGAGAADMQGPKADGEGSALRREEEDGGIASVVGCDTVVPIPPSLRRIRTRSREFEVVLEDLPPPNLLDVRPLLPSRPPDDPQEHTAAGPTQQSPEKMLESDPIDSHLLEGAAAPECTRLGGRRRRWWQVLGRRGALQARRGSSEPWTARQTVASHRGFWSTLWDMLLDIYIVARGPEAGAFRMALWLAVFNQAFASTAIINYGPELLKRTGVADVRTAVVLNSLVTASKMVGVILSFFLVDSLGRRPLLLFGSLGCSVALALLMVAYWAAAVPLVVAAMCAFIFAFSASWAGVFWVVLSEIFSMSIKSPAASAATAMLFLAGAVSDFVFLSFLSWLGALHFLLLALLALTAALYVAKVVPETKGHLLQDVQEMLRGSGQRGVGGRGEVQARVLLPHPLQAR